MRSKSHILKPVIPSAPPGRRIQISGFREKSRSAFETFTEHMEGKKCGENSSKCCF